MDIYLLHVEQEFIEDNFSCPYTDGDFESYITTMRDIPKTGTKREAILQLLKKCVVHWKRGEGKLYGTYSRITYGEVYKIIIRSLWLPFNEDLAWHRALPYKAAARKAKLLQWSDTSHSLDDIADTKDVIVLLTNMVNYNWGSIDTLALESIRTPYILRGNLNKKYSNQNNIHNTTITQNFHTNDHFVVLWRKKDWPIIAPIHPPNAVRYNSVFSEILHPCILARYLSRQNMKKVVTLTTIR